MTKLKSHNLNLTLHVISTYKYDDKNKRKVRKKEEKSKEKRREKRKKNGDRERNTFLSFSSSKKKCLLPPSAVEMSLPLLKRIHSS